MKRFKTSAAFLFPLLALLPAANAQTITGSVFGTVADSAGAVVVGANVQIINDVSRQIREFQTSNNGGFEFIALIPGGYIVKIAQPGFKTYEERVTVSAQERVDLHTIKLVVGDVSTSIDVAAEAAHVATDSSDRSINVNTQQIADTPIKGRDFKAIVKSLPGVQDLNNHDSRGWGGDLPTINGGQQGQVVMTLDGIVSEDSGNYSLNSTLSPSTDAIAEVKLLVSNYTAEYGARNGGQLNVTIKSGSPQFHGTAYYDFRHEEFDANEFFNNKTGVQKPKYRYQNPGGTIGGPVIIPGTRFNKDRNRLFFFYSFDKLFNQGTYGPNRYTMPTALERTGDFSQSVNSNGTPILIRDPSTGATCSSAGAAGCYPGNKIPASRISAIGAAMLNLFPLPNTTDPTGARQYNAQFQFTNQQPRQDQILRVDYNISSKDTTYVRLIKDGFQNNGPGAILGALGDGWGQFPHAYSNPSKGIAATYVHTFRPNLINELNVGENYNHQSNAPTNQTSFAASLLPLKDSSGNALKLPNLFGANYLNLLPQINFGLPSGFSAQSAPTGIPNLPQFGFDSRWPFDGADQSENLTDNITWIKGRHTFKAGIYLENEARNVSVYSVYNTAGTYYFGSDLGNPVDTGNPFSNALTGNLYGYGEDNKKQINHSRYTQFEWFAQDTWKVNRRLTVDVGFRFQFIGTLRSQNATLGIFDFASYSANSGQLLFPTCTVTVTATASCPTADKASINPKTGKIYPYAQQGTFDPASYPANGLPFSGIKTAQTMLFNNPPIQVAPRIGLAYDVFGDGKTAIRTGFGISYGRSFTVDTIGATGAGVGPIAAPPNFVAPLILNTSITSLVGSTAVYTPQATTGGSLNLIPPSTYNWSFGIQQDLRKGFVLDVSYIGNVAHHQFNQGQDDFNAVAPYTTWSPTANNGSPGPVAKYLDPTSANGGTAGLYSTNLIRALANGVNWAAIQAYTQNGESNYNALQISVNRRFARRFQLGGNYTWSKTLVYSREQFVTDQLLKNVTNRPVAVNINFGYDIPGLDKYWKSKASKLIFSDWHLSGIATFYDGNPYSISCSANSAPPGYWTGSVAANGSNNTGFPLRCQQTGSMWLPAGATPSSVWTGSNSSLAVADPKLWYNFNPAAFTLPSVTSFGIGNEQPTLGYGPGVENFDLAIQKEINVGSEAHPKVLSFKFEAFNALNHFNPNNPNTSLSINCNPTNGACAAAPSLANYTNTTFGTITSAATPARHGAVTLRFRF